jgi:hypothetical protein
MVECSTIHWKNQIQHVDAPKQKAEAFFKTSAFMIFFLSINHPQAAQALEDF